MMTLLCLCLRGPALGKEVCPTSYRSSREMMRRLREPALTSESMDRYVPPRGQAVSCLALLSSHLGTAVLDVPQNQQQQQQHRNNQAHTTPSQTAPGMSSHHR
ncbi:hypothetical protein BV898_02891 [Hypsibius exemplaris]|uniref:Secreted protein n=1 Tax=Hypsibius exemplaris TaxID=2072580 RepID=A0A1W0X6H4_HYPEX|nr:hypothetical protein BV898_02891 [Hypsibius exemplaris]